MRTRLAGLDVTVFQGTPGPPSAAIILCHGFGAPGDDLVGLAPELVRAAPLLSTARFYFPAAPLELGGFGFGDARAWWMIDIEAIARLQQRDEEALREFRRREPEGLPAARRALHALVQEIANQTGLPFSKLVLGGFSQGAMLATDVALRLEEPPGGLVILSGTLLIEDTWRAKATGRAGLPVFQSHGRADPILSFAAAESLRDLLRAAGLTVEWVPFDGGHTIGAEAVSGLKDFLMQRVTR
jgi:phospholipase/carboxylesterase